MINKFIGILLAAIMLTTAMAGCSAGCSEEQQFMDRTNNVTITTPAIPPIDTMTSVKMETATFALG